MKLVESVRLNPSLTKLRNRRPLTLSESQYTNSWLIEQPAINIAEKQNIPVNVVVTLYSSGSTL